MQNKNRVRRTSEKVVFRSKNGKYIVKEVVDVVEGKKVRKMFRQGGESVTILPLLDNETILIENQYRATIGKWGYELPSGKIDTGESALDAASRELEEEAGYRAQNIKFIYKRFIAPSFTDGTDSVFIARQLTKTKSHLEADEQIKLTTMKVSTLLNLIKKGVIKNPELIEPFLFWYTFNKNAVIH
ncbi:MAG: NUDIX hydrolase [Candidatus Micrarchaeota archaeon]|nr:NUDIX hydrolase [Candidatus Micrarchaeota archaeon]